MITWTNIVKHIRESMPVKYVELSSKMNMSDLPASIDHSYCIELGAFVDFVYYSSDSLSYDYGITLTILYTINSNNDYDSCILEAEDIIGVICKLKGFKKFIDNPTNTLLEVNKNDIQFKFNFVLCKKDYI